jgi:hypothetical protein
MNPEQTVVLRSAVLAKEAAPVLAPVLTKDARELSQFMRDQNVGKDPQKALELFAGKATPRNVARAMLDQDLGTQTALREDITGMKDRITNPTPTFEKTEFAESHAKLNDIYNAIENGTVTRYEQNQILATLYRDDIYRDLLKKVHPALDTDISRIMTNTRAIPPGIQNLIDSIARDPAFKQKIADLLAQRFDPTKKREKPADMDSLKSELAKIDLELNPTPGTGTSAQKQFNEISVQLKEYQLDPMTGAPRPRLKDIQDFRSEVSKKEGELSLIKSKIDRARGFLNDKDASIKGGAISDVSTGEADHATKTIELADAKAKLKTAEEARDALTNEHKELERKLTTMDHRKREIQKELAGMNPNKRIEDQSLIAAVDTLYRDATVEALNDKLHQAEAKYQELIDERKKKEAEALDAKFEENLREKWFTTRGKNQLFFIRYGEKEVVVDKKEVEQDYREYILNGPKVIMTEVMGREVEDSIKKKYGVTTLTAPMRKEVDQKIDELTKTKGKEAVLRMLVQMRRSGHDFTMQDATTIERYNPEVFQEMLNQDRELKRKAEELAKSGAIDPVSLLPRSFVRRHINHALDNISGTWSEVKTDEPIDVH